MSTSHSETDVKKINATSNSNRQNCLNLIRLIAAIAVFSFHALTHLKISIPVMMNGIIGFFRGVPIFFAMSGYLVWDSVGRSSGFIPYAKKRFWRIYPELWCAVILSIVMILLLYKEHISWVWLGAFTVTQGTVLQFWTPDFLRGYGCGTPNGSLWTIGVTVQFYIAIYFGHKLLRNKKLGCWMGVLTGFILVAVLSPLLSKVLPEIIYKLYGQTLIPYAWLFLLGAMIAANRTLLLPFLKKYWCVFLGLSAFFMITGADVGAGNYRVFKSTTLILGIIGFAYRYPGLEIKLDISYGVYIYHMIVINAMIALGFTNKPIWLLNALLITCLLAFVSERTVGRAAMLIKNRINIQKIGGHHE